MRVFVAIGVSVASLVVAAAAWSAEIADEITLRVRDYVNPGTQVREVEVAGRIASNAPGETVEVLLKECGPLHTAYRVIGGDKTAPGGSWRIVSNQAPDYVQIPPNAYFRARWRGHLSEPVLNQVPAFVSVRWRPRLRVAEVAASSLNTGQNLRGRFVELQRKVEGTDMWVRIRRARLGRGTFARGLGQQFKTRFSVPTRGLTLRVLVPGDTGAPCFAVGVSQTWRS